MHSPTILLLELLSCFALAAASPIASDACTQPNPDFTSSTYLEKIASNHLAIFSGDFALVNQTWQPDVHLYQDRNPEPFGSIDLNITNSTAYLGYVHHLRTGFSPLTVHPRYMLTGAYKVAVRWTLESKVDANITQIAPLTTSKPGDSVVYNSTDILLISPTTGLVCEADSAFDIINYEYQLGYKTLNVG